MTEKRLTPAQQNKLWARQNFTGSLGIFTIVSGWYQWYVPMFLYMMKKELPAAVPLVYIRGEVTLSKEWADQCKRSEVLEDFPNDGYTTAALRYVFSDSEIQSFDYVHITDSDMMLMAETPDLINQHCRHMGRFGLQCYDNYVSAVVNGMPKCPGVHFVTKEWWDKTDVARKDFRTDLKKEGSNSWDWDEIMLGEIIKRSGLPLCEDPILWAHHGVHLGDWRRRLQKGHQYPSPEASHQMLIKKMVGDPEFMEIENMCEPHCEELAETFELFRKL